MSCLLPSRPLQREVVHYRDDHKVVIACDDTYAPDQYFSNVELPRTEIVILPTTDTKSYIEYVLDRLFEINREDDDELWLVVDTDHCVTPNNIGHFSSEIGRAEKSGIHVALSCPCFEYWLALYHAEPEELNEIMTAKQLGQILDELVAASRVHREGYDKTNVQVSDFPDDKLAEAIRRARRQDDSMKGQRIPMGNTTRIYRIWESLLRRFEEFQVPERYLEAYYEVRK